MGAVLRLIASLFPLEMTIEPYYIEGVVESWAAAVGTRQIFRVRPLRAGGAVIPAPCSRAPKPAVHILISSHNDFGTVVAITTTGLRVNGRTVFFVYKLPIPIVWLPH